MKKILSLLLITGLAVFFTGCGNNQPKSKERFPSEIPMKNGKLHGTVKHYHFRTGKLRRSIDYINGVKNGKEIVYDDRTGKIRSSTEFVNGKRNGELVLYRYVGSTLFSIEKSSFKDDIRVGTLTAHDTNENLLESTPYKDGEKHGISKLYYSDGQLSEIAPYKDGKRHGVTKKYHTNGKLKEVMPYTNGELNGLYKYYNKDGSLNHKQYYKNYNEVGKKQYSASEKRKMAQEERERKERARQAKLKPKTVQKVYVSCKNDPYMSISKIDSDRATGHGAGQGTALGASMKGLRQMSEVEKHNFCAAGLSGYSCVYTNAYMKACMSGL